MNRIVDFHTHILPGIDDGSGSLEESMALLRMEAEQGIGHVMATPHFYPMHDDPERFLERRKAAEARLREEMEKRSGLPRLSVGAEVYYFPGISESDILPELTIGSKRCILIEMPMSVWTEHMYRELEGIAVKQGLMPVIAHMDRYIRPFRTYGIPQRLAELPVYVQANAGFFLDRSTASMAMRLLREDKIQLLGSDCHNLASRMPNLGPAVQTIEKRLGAGVLERICAYQDEVLADAFV